MESQSKKEPDIKLADGAQTKIKEEFVNNAEGIKNKVADLGGRVVDKIDAQRARVASTMEKTASTLQDQGDKAVYVAQAAADKLQSTADYVRENDTKAMFNDVGRFVKRHPGKSLAVAAAAGFLVGRMFRQNDV